MLDVNDLVEHSQTGQYQDPTHGKYIVRFHAVKQGTSEKAGNEGRQYWRMSCEVLDVLDDRSEVDLKIGGDKTLNIKSNRVGDKLSTGGFITRNNKKFSAKIISGALMAGPEGDPDLKVLAEEEAEKVSDTAKTKRQWLEHFNAQYSDGKTFNASIGKTFGILDVRTSTGEGGVVKTNSYTGEPWTQVNVYSLPEDQYALLKASQE